MLVLSRHKSEGITIQHPSGNIHVMVVDILGDKVRIGVEAAKSVKVHRDEVWAAIEREEIKRRMAAGEPLNEIESDLDWRENQP